MKKDDCIFCKIANGIIPSPALYEDGDFKVILDRGPASKGHALILPKEHFDNAFELDEERAARVFSVAKKVGKAICEETGCDGMNFLQNNNEAAGQTVFHFHMHIIPRYVGDTVKVGWNPGDVTDAEIEQFAEKINSKLS